MPKIEDLKTDIPNEIDFTLGEDVEMDEPKIDGVNIYIDCDTEEGKNRTNCDAFIENFSGSEVQSRTKLTFNDYKGKFEDIEETPREIVKSIETSTFGSLGEKMLINHISFDLDESSGILVKGSRKQYYRTPEERKRMVANF
jgi:hypothetical protein